MDALIGHAAASERWLTKDEASVASWRLIFWQSTKAPGWVGIGSQEAGRHCVGGGGKHFKSTCPQPLRRVTIYSMRLSNSWYQDATYVISPIDDGRWRTCPLCGRSCQRLPALSRRDNATWLCAECGIDQALRDHNRGYPYGSLR